MCKPTGLTYAAPVVTARIHSILEIHLDYNQKKILKEMNYPTKRMWQMYPDYLSEVRLWYPGGHRCILTDTKIPVKKVITDKQLNLRDVTDQTQLVVLPRKALTFSQKIQIRKAAGRADSVTVLGRFSGLGRYSRTGRFWEFSDYGTYWWERGGYERDMTEPVPIIWIEPRQGCSKKLMRALSQKLNADGYVNLCISKDSLSSLYGIRYIPREMKWENAIRCIEKVTELSVLIIEGLGRVHTKEDFAIHFTSATSFKRSEHQLWIPEKENLKYLEKIYQIIIE